MPKINCMWDYIQTILTKHLQLFQENCWVSWSGLRPWWIGFVSRFAARFSVKDQLNFSQKSSSSLTAQNSLWTYLLAWKKGDQRWNKTKAGHHSLRYGTVERILQSIVIDFPIIKYKSQKFSTFGTLSFWSFCTLFAKDSVK